MERCWAYLPSGKICGREAVAVDPLRGYTVCAEHAWWMCGNCETWNPVEYETCEDCGLPRQLVEDVARDPRRM